MGEGGRNATIVNSRRPPKGVCQEAGNLAVAQLSIGKRFRAAASDPAKQRRRVRDLVGHHDRTSLPISRRLEVNSGAWASPDKPTRFQQGFLKVTTTDDLFTNRFPAGTPFCARSSVPSTRLLHDQCTHLDSSRLAPFNGYQSTGLRAGRTVLANTTRACARADPGGRSTRPTTPKRPLLFLIFSL